MPSPYTGQAVPPPGQDAPPPLAGAAPAPSLVVDTDAPVAASFIPAPKTNADFITWIQKILNGAPSMAPSAVAGFGAVAHSGAGTGTVTPTAVSATQTQLAHKPVYVALKIITSGVAGGGVAQAQWSNDGGATYPSAAFNIPNVPKADPNGTSSGITVTFAGTFTAGDIYSLVPTCQPQLALKDSSGLVRGVFDHNGYQMGRQVVLDEPWLYGDSQPAVGGSPPYALLPGTSGTTLLGAGASGGSRWQANGTASVGSVGTATDSNVGRVAKLTTGTANGNKTYLQLTSILPSASTKQILVAEWDFSTGGSIGFALGSVTLMMGFASSYAGMSGSGNYLWFKTVGNQNWQLQASNGSHSNSQDSGIAPSGVMQRFRLEFHGSGTPLGVAVGAAVALFFIGETLVGVFSGNYLDSTAVNLPLMFGVELTGALGSPLTFSVGPVRVAYARSYPDIDSMPAL